MISLLFPRSPLCTAAIVVYTCVCIPLEEAKRAVSRWKHGDEGERCQRLPCLPVAVFKEMELKHDKPEEDLCPICLVQFQAEDVVTLLPSCSHLFHLHCMETWLLRDHLTCPLCRSFVFSSFSLSSSSSLPTSTLCPLALPAFCLSLLFFFASFSLR